MGKIQLLDTTVSARIAAGEVVERPSSIVKELAENSIDANASAITIAVQEGGIREIRVTDNGDGIAPEDMPLAVVKHATSKIYTMDDLEMTEYNYKRRSLVVRFKEQISRLLAPLM